MPNCIQFTSKTTSKTVSFVEIDEELCKMLGVKPHPTLFVESWYDLLGWPLSMGASLEKLQKEFPKEEKPLGKIISYLNEHYTVNAWYERKIPQGT